MISQGVKEDVSGATERLRRYILVNLLALTDRDHPAVVDGGFLQDFAHHFALATASRTRYKPSGKPQLLLFHPAEACIFHSPRTSQRPLSWRLLHTITQSQSVTDPRLHTSNVKPDWSTWMS